MFKGDIEKLTEDNKYYRKVLTTTPNMQLVLMSLKPGEEIGLETHYDASQFIRVEAGNGVAYISGKRFHLRDGDCIVVPVGRAHNVINTGQEDLKLYTVYSAPVHDKTCKQKNKQDNEC